MPDLSGSSAPVQLAPGYELTAPGLVGTITEMTAEASATRGDAGLHEPAFLRALAGADVYAGKVFEIELSAEAPALADDGTRADGLTNVTRSGEPAGELAIPHQEEETDYAVLYTDEGGYTRWILPSNPPAPDTPVGAPVRFNLPRESAPTPPDAARDSQMRGPISKLGRRLVRVLAWASAGVIGAGALKVAEKWESDHRPYGFHVLTPERYATDDPQGDPVDWTRLGAGRALLLLHGTFSTAQASYAQLGAETIKRLCDHYGGRVFAFNHPSLHQSPQDNVRQFLAEVPAGVQLDLDIMTHSRGGLVGRELVERMAVNNAAHCQVRVRRALLVASPNQGTILTDPDNGLDLLDRYTNLLTNLPDNAYTLTLEGILAVAKLLAYGALTGLPGLRCLLPGGDYLADLNGRRDHAADYYAITADYTPTDPAWIKRLGRMAADRFVDGIFGGENDMVVPTLGSYAAGDESFGFPIPEEHLRVYRGEAGVHHTNYFSTPVVREQIVAWLTSD